MEQMTASTQLSKALKSAVSSVALVASILTFTACSGGGGGDSQTSTTPPAESPVALEASPPGALLDYVQQKLYSQVDQGLALPSYREGTAIGDNVLAATVSDSTTKQFSSTTLQEVGVDESDLMKTDGTRIFSLSIDTPNDYRLTKLRVDRRLSDGSLQSEGSLALSGTDRIEGLHLAASGEQLALLGQSEQWFAYTLADATKSSSMTLAPGPITTPQTVVDLVDIKTAQTLSKTRSLRIDGQLIDSRMIGNILYVVTTWSPPIDGIPQPGAATPAERKTAIAHLTNQDLLPTLTITSANTPGTALSQPLLADTDCYLQPKNASFGVQLTTITAFNLGSPSLERTSRCFLGGTNALYVSPKNIYLATSRHESVNKKGIMAYSSQATTDIHKFAISGMNINYRGSGEVSGHLGWDTNKNPYRMSEYQNDLRVLTYTEQFGWFGEIDAIQTGVKASPAILSVLREDSNGSKLTTISTLPNTRHPTPIGLSGEQVYAVRFLGDRGYVVTFRRTDPLYILDLADPADPKITGELKTNGYSDYLLPLTEGLLLGVGKDATETGRVQGIKVSLFDVSNANNTKELASRVIGKAGSTSALDYTRHGINLLTAGTTTRVTLPGLVQDTPDPANSDWFRPSYQGLLRFEIDLVKKTLSDRPVLLGQTFAADLSSYPNSWLGYERSVQIEQHVYYLTGSGKLQSAAW